MAESVILLEKVRALSLTSLGPEFHASTFLCLSSAAQRDFLSYLGSWSSVVQSLFSYCITYFPSCNSTRNNGENKDSFPPLAQTAQGSVKRLGLLVKFPSSFRPNGRERFPSHKLVSPTSGTEESKRMCFSIKSSDLVPL